MPLVSVQISLGPRVLRPWSIIDASSAANLWDVFVGLRDGSLACGSYFSISTEIDQPVKCSVGVALGGYFQDCPLNLLIEEVSKNFGKSLNCASVH